MIKLVKILVGIIYYLIMILISYLIYSALEIINWVLYIIKKRLDS